jgi:NADH-quinone oxidoreductase subunit E
MKGTTVQTRIPEELLRGNGHFSEILHKHEGRADNLIPLLQRVQRMLGYLPEWALLEISDYVAMPSAKVFGVATFYSQFRLQPVGEHIIRVCRGTACHVRGSNRILKEIQSHLRVLPGETTKDRLFTLETVACFGSCALAPVTVVDDTVYGRMNPSKVLALLQSLREEARESFAIEACDERRTSNVQRPTSNEFGNQNSWLSEVQDDYNDQVSMEGRRPRRLRKTAGPRSLHF